MSCTWVQSWEGWILRGPRKDAEREEGVSLCCCNSFQTQKLPEKRISPSWALAEQQTVEENFSSQMAGFNLITEETRESPESCKDLTTPSKTGLSPRTPHPQSWPPDYAAHWVARGLYSQDFLWSALNSLQLQRKWGWGISQGWRHRPIYFCLLNKHLGSICWVSVTTPHALKSSSYNPQHNLLLHNRATRWGRYPLRFCSQAITPIPVYVSFIWPGNIHAAPTMSCST